MPTPKVLDLLERNKNFKTPLAPPMIADIDKRNHTAGGPRGIVVISCSDPRIIPEQYFSAGRMEFAVIRNAGGRASDALRSLYALDAIGNIGTVIVVHHTDCGMTHMPDVNVRKVLKARAPEAGDEIEDMSFGEIIDVDASIREDVKLLKEDRFLSKELDVLGFNLDIHTGVMTEVK